MNFEESKNNQEMRIIQLEDELEILREQVNSLKQGLQFEYQELKLIERELKYTNDELGREILFKKLAFDEAKKLAKSIM